MSQRVPAENLPSVFSEEAFYLREFRGRSIGFVVRECDPAGVSTLSAVFEKLRGNDTRVVCFSDTPSFFEAIHNVAVLETGTPQIEVEVWRKLQGAASVGVLIEDEGNEYNGGEALLAQRARESALCDLALRLGLSKVVWIDREGGIQAADGSDLSFVDLAGLCALESGAPGLRAGIGSALREFELLLDAGVQSISLCSPDTLSDELFTFSGSGTLFTKGKYVSVRALSLDDFDAAAAFIERGVEEGFLLPRTQEEIDALLASSYGAFVEDRFLAGIASLRINEKTHSGEIAGLYTLTRFMGGVGRHLVNYAMDRARTRGLKYLYACTTSPAAGDFFERNEFSPVECEALPASKWEGYPKARREKLLCFRRDCNSKLQDGEPKTGAPGA